jgi:hypothetical protein
MDLDLLLVRAKGDAVVDPADGKPNRVRLLRRPVNIFADQGFVLKCLLPRVKFINQF